MAGQMIEFQSNGGTARGYLAVPEGGRGPGVVVLQEWWGLVPPPPARARPGAGRAVPRKLSEPFRAAA